MENPETQAPLTIKEWQKKVFETAKSKGWWDEIRSFGDLMALVHSEVSEAFEEYRSGNPECFKIYFRPENPTKPEGIPTELADIVIRVLDLCEYHGIDLQEAMEVKNRYNETRTHKHGGKVL